jgi:hypothetical protein
MGKTTKSRGKTETDSGLTLVTEDEKFIFLRKNKTGHEFSDATEAIEMTYI